MSLPPLPTEPVLPLGTLVRARPVGWEEAQADSYDQSFTDGLDILPTLDGVPEWIEGPPEGGAVTVGSRSYFKHQVNGWDVDPSTISEQDQD
jgi:hypothetical protein